MDIRPSIRGRCRGLRLGFGCVQEDLLFQFRPEGGSSTTSHASDAHASLHHRLEIERKNQKVKSTMKRDQPENDAGLLLGESTPVTQSSCATIHSIATVSYAVQLTGRGIRPIYILA